MKITKLKNISDLILDFLVKKKVKKIFLITGGSIAFTIDSFSKRKDISYICVQHEQAAAMMADAYSRVGPNFSATMSTSGPGGTNLITGIGCSYFDSIPALHIVGQVNVNEQRGVMRGTKNSRQIGFQETDIVSISKPLTKLSIQLKNEKDILYILEKLFYISQKGRQGPVLLDLPMNFQRLPVPKNLKKFNPPKLKHMKINYKNIVDLFKGSKRPVILSGGGVRYSAGVKEFNSLIKLLKIPIVTSWSGVDTISYSNKNYIGHVGVYGSRSGNFTIQNADLILSLGSRLDTRITGGKPSTFARNAKLIMVDIDKGELEKRRGFTPFKEIKVDVLIFLKNFKNELLKNKNYKSLGRKTWLDTCKDWKIKYPTFDSSFGKDKKFVNPYKFTDVLSNKLNNKEIIIPDDGAHLTWFMQAFKVKLGQRVFSAFGNSPMGYSFPASIGASIALNKKRVICIDGDGSFQMNIQELQTVVNEKVPIKIFILNNNGYGIIKQFQEIYLDKRFEATGKGVSVPNYEKIANAYNIKYYSIRNDKEIDNKLDKILSDKSANIINVFVHPTQKIIPKIAFGSPIEDMSPKLSKSELKNNMMISIIGADKNLLESN